MTPLPRHCAVVGPGRIGSALVPALRAAGIQVSGPLGRGERCPQADCVLLCVPDAEIGQAASDVMPGPLVGHLSGATTLEPLAGHEAFSLHPLLAVTRRPVIFEGVPAAVAGTSERSLATARALAEALGMTPFEIADADRAAYHAAASMASNYLVALEDAAERLLATTGAPRELLVPLVRATVDNWARDGARALTGPIARGDEATVERQRAAVEERTPELLELWDALAGSTRGLVAA
ncbi:MAG: hypothetical protein QOH62_2084 [Solirubrobacteraceae bacterium]|nr:hypothetical protein [Solirubrobacteraceae bacterium]